MSLDELVTPALLIDAEALAFNLETMAKALPGRALRPHVKAHKCTALARRQAALGHTGFTCATVREMEGMAAAGLGEDLLLANEVVDPRQLARLAPLEARVTVAVDSEATVEAAAGAGGALREVLVDVNVGLPRCGCPPEQAGRIADLARSRGLEVRGVMGYEGHLMLVGERGEREKATGACMEILSRAHEQVGGDVISAGGTGTFDCNRLATEIQAGSYALMDTAYGKLDIPFRPALSLLATVISVSEAYAVADGGLKSLGMDHGNPTLDGGKIWFCSDEHVTFAPEAPVRVGDRVRLWPAHVDPTIAYHDHLHLVANEEVSERWPVDLRGW